ncbi:MAG TPA: hypothetical protein VE993_11510 [Stellaceae bacterium]|nr:hypothetical protein [Stellaceae bacterium]
MLYFIIPLWLWAGVADWLCRRAAAIEHTAGPKESLMHLAMLIEIGVPSLAGLFLEITAPRSRRYRLTGITPFRGSAAR